MYRLWFLLTLFFSLQGYAQDPWEKAFKAKEALLLGQHKAAEKILLSLKKDLMESEKTNMDWELLKWTEDEIRHSQKAQTNSEPPRLADFAKVRHQPPSPGRRDWYKSHWALIGGGALIALFVNHERQKSKRKGPVVTEGFVP